MKYSSRFFLYAPVGVFLLLLAAAGIHWWIAASRLATWLDAHNGREIMPGVTMRFDARSITGFPFSLDTEFENVSFTVATPLGPTQWRSEHFAMHGLTYGRDETIFEAAGRQFLRWTRPDRTMRALEFAVASLRASAIDKNGGLERFDLDLVGFGSKAFTAQRLQIHLRRNGADKLDLYLLSSGLRSAAGSCPRLDYLASGELEGSADRAEAFSPLLSAKQDWNGAVADWRKRGGRFRNARATAGSRPADTAFQAGLAAIPADRLFAVGAVADAICGSY